MSAPLFSLLVSGVAQAYVDPDCAAVAALGPPADYNEQAQADFLLNYFALATTLSPVHAPVPHQPGNGAIGLEIDVIPPLSCERRLVLDYTRTEDTNKAPIAPRPRITFAFPKTIWDLVPYAGVAYVPPVTVFGTRNVILSGEFGLGRVYDGGLSWSLRYHATLMKTIAEIATPFDPADTPYLDFYMGSTFGGDFMLGYKVAGVTPYVALGFTDVSTFFYIGDDGWVGNNFAPYAGFTGSAGAQIKLGRAVNAAAEFYTAPGVLYTGRLRISYVFQPREQDGEG